MVLLTVDRVTVNRARKTFCSFALAITFFVTGQATHKKARQVEGIKVSSE